MALEGAIVFLFLFTILAGVVDVSMFFKDTYSVSTAARAGARTAAADPMNTTFARDAARQAASAMTDLDWQRVTEIWVYKANPTTGATMTGSTCAVQCVRFTLIRAGCPERRVGRLDRAERLHQPHRPGGLGRRAGAVPHTAPVMFADNQIITERVVMRLEQIPSTQHVQVGMRPPPARRAGGRPPSRRRS